MSAGLPGVQNADASSEHSEENFEIPSNCLSTSKILDSNEGALYIDDNEFHSAEVITSYMDCIEKQKSQAGGSIFCCERFEVKNKGLSRGKGLEIMAERKGSEV
ncbi:hypothetical protein HPP92_013434 [Vanilla planifolia]|uniref:Uncharacterized protein n=1 Tax=Vanilla planifolia TaxID=51239 RepID=A0A835QS93_VANPL|nr:hypothetical protein HPP92_013434 [Vanilla planifolia]